MSETVEDIIRASRLAELTEKANAIREELATQLERLAIDVRVDHHSPISGVVFLIEPQGTRMVRLGEVRKSSPDGWETLREIAQAARDAHSASCNRKDHCPERNVIAGSERRRLDAEIEERKEAAYQTEFAYKCDWCEFRSRTKRGCNQHMMTQKRLACVGCGLPRCEALERRRGWFMSYETDYKGILTCGKCVKAQKVEQPGEVEA